MVEISTSVLTVEPKNATQTFYNLEVAKTDYFHIDVMDGKFVVKDTARKMKEYATTLKHISNLPLDVHLMVEDVEKFIDDYAELEPNIITFHYESNIRLSTIVERIEKLMAFSRVLLRVFVLKREVFAVVLLLLLPPFF